MLMDERINAELVITRIFDAPRKLVWKAWTEPERLMRWWGPKNFTAPVATIDFKIGGTYLNCMRSPDGKDYWSTGVYREIVADGWIVYTDSFADDKGNVVPASYYGMDGGWPLEMLVTVTFAIHDNNKTIMTLRHIGIPEGKPNEDTHKSWNQSFDKLAEYLKNNRS